MLITFYAIEPTHTHRYILVYICFHFIKLAEAVVCVCVCGVIQQAKRPCAHHTHPHPHPHSFRVLELTNLLFNIGSLIVGGSRYDARIREGCAQQGAHREEIQHGSHDGNNWINARRQKWAAAKEAERERYRERGRQ